MAIKCGTQIEYAVDHHGGSLLVTFAYASSGTSSIVDPSKLEPKKLRDSYHQVILKLSSSPELRLQYVTAFNTVRIGRLLEDLVRDHSIPNQGCKSCA